MFRRLAAVFVFACALRADPGACPGGVSVTTFRLSASPATATRTWMPVRQINNLPSGYRVRYQPGTLPQDVGKEAAVALVVLPTSGDGEMRVLPPAPVTGSTEWTVPFDASTVFLIFAPQGFDEKRLTNLVSRDPDILSALAEYAQQTQELEDTLDALRHMDDHTEAALDDGRPLSPTEQALLALLRTVNPAVSTYNPLGTGQRAGPTGLMGRGASMFFENAGGAFPGSGALPSVKQFLMPDTEFRSVYGAGAEGGSMTLCAQRQPKTRNKIAYVWAYRLTTAAAPAPAIVEETADLAIGLRGHIHVKLPAGVDWDVLRGFTDWGLAGASGGAPLHIDVQPSTTSRELLLDLRNFAGLPGEYSLEARWDWSTVRLNGKVRLHKLDDLSQARVTAESSDAFVANAGWAALDVAGAQTEFVNRVALRRAEGTQEIRVDVTRQNPLRVEVDTDSLKPGPYVLSLGRVDGATADIPLRLLSPAPRVDLSNARVNLGEPQQAITLRGTGLDQVESLESANANIEWQGSTRNAIVRLRPGAAAGDSLELMAKVTGRANPLRLGVLQVAPTRPKILDVRTGLPTDLAVTLRAGEIPVGSAVTVALRVEPSGATPLLTLGCAGQNRVPQNYTKSAADTLFFSLDSRAFDAGCKLMATIDTADRGASDPFALGTVVRVPRIEKLTLTNDAAQGGYAATLEGWDLESIERTGWNASQGLPTTDLPRPISTGDKQTLRIALPWPSPSPKAPLYIWLRGEQEGRATRVTP